MLIRIEILTRIDSFSFILCLLVEIGQSVEFNTWIKRTNQSIKES